MTVAPQSPLRNLTKPSDQYNWLVCGWFTDDPIYRPLAQRLAASLEAHGTPYDLVSVAKLPGGWEANTMAKPGQVLAAMSRHPEKTIVFLDVDYTATGDLAWLAQVPGDVAMKMSGKRRRTGSVRLTVGSQVMVLKPTAHARRFVEQWARLARNPEPGDTDEAYLALAFGDVSEVAVSSLDKSRIDAVLTHSWANRQSARMGGRRREVVNLVLSGIRAVTRRGRI